MECHTGVESGACVGLPEPVENHSWVESLHFASVALLASLPAPVAVVEVVASEAVTFLKCGRVACTACWRTESGERDAVLSVDFLLHCEEVAPALVERAWNHAFASIAANGAERNSPSVWHQAGAVSGHTTPAVVAVGVSHATTETGSVVLGVGADVVGTTHFTEGITTGVETHTNRLALERLVQTAKHREVEAAAGSVVEVHAVDVLLSVLRVVATNAETRHAEVVAGSLIKWVVTCTRKSGNGLCVAFLVFELRFCNHQVGLVIVDRLRRVER